MGMTYNICLTWYSGCPLRSDNPYRFSGHMTVGQGQTSGLWKNVLLVAKLSTVNASRERR